jgi:hypothetical protein
MYQLHINFLFIQNDKRVNCLGIFVQGTVLHTYMQIALYISAASQLSNMTIL